MHGLEICNCVFCIMHVKDITIYEIYNNKKQNKYLRASMHVVNVYEIDR